MDADAHELRQQVDALARPYVEGQYVVGMSVGVITPTTRFTAHYGVTRHDGPPPDDRTLYEIGSITKTMTGLLLADGVTRGAYTLDTPVSELLAEKAEVDPRITLGRLSTHTSGLPRLPINLYPYNPRDPYAVYDERRLLKDLRSIYLPDEPGQTSRYSNLGVGLLGYALAEQAGTDYESLLKERLLVPLGMNRTTITLRKDNRARMAGPHNADGEPASLWDLNVLAGAGGVRSDLHDMLTYARAQIRPDTTPLADAIRLSQSPQQRPGEASFGNPMGLGWFIGEGGVLMHGGQTGGFKALIFVAPEKQSAVVVLANTSNDFVQSFGNQLHACVLKGQAVGPAELPAVVEVPTETLERYVGRYRLDGAGVIDVTRAEGRLYAQLTNQPRFRLFPETPSRFRYRVVRATIDFEYNDLGEVDRLVLTQDGRRHVCPRISAEDASE